MPGSQNLRVEQRRGTIKYLIWLITRGSITFIQCYAGKSLYTVGRILGKWGGRKHQEFLFPPRGQSNCSLKLKRLPWALKDCATPPTPLSLGARYLSNYIYRRT